MNTMLVSLRRLYLAAAAFVIAMLIPTEPARAAIAFDSAVSKSTINAASVTWSHTVGTGTNRVLIVGLSTEDTSSTVLNVASITYNGVAMTAVSGSAATAGSS